MHFAAAFALPHTFSQVMPHGSGSGGSQPPMTLALSLGESAGFRPLHAVVGRFGSWSFHSIKPFAEIWSRAIRKFQFPAKACECAPVKIRGRAFWACLL